MSRTECQKHSEAVVGRAAFWRRSLPTLLPSGSASEHPAVPTQSRALPKVREPTAAHAATSPCSPGILSTHEISAFLDSSTAIPNPLQETSPLLIFAFFT